MDYASAIWGYQRHGCCDNIQRRVIRNFMGVGKKTPLPALESDMGWYPPYLRHKVEIIRLWCRLCLMPLNRLSIALFATSSTGIVSSLTEDWTPGLRKQELYWTHAGFMRYAVHDY